MGDWTKIIYDKMPMFYGQVLMQKYLSDPSISFCAIGDYTSDEAPLQVTNFSQGKEIDSLISKMYLEGCGGGGYSESYDMAAYFYAKHTKLTNPELPFFFVTGDEGFYDPIKGKNIRKVMGENYKEVKDDEQISAINIWNLLSLKYNVFLLKKPFHNEKK